jgi:hypothetical protein
LTLYTNSRLFLGPSLFLILISLILDLHICCSGQLTIA